LFITDSPTLDPYIHKQAKGRQELKEIHGYSGSLLEFSWVVLTKITDCLGCEIRTYLKEIIT